MLRIWRWDEVSGEVDQADLPHVDEDSPAHRMIAANDQLCDYQPTGEYDKFLFTDFPNFRLVTGRWGRDRQYMLWWGDKLDCKRFADLLANH